EAAKTTAAAGGLLKAITPPAEGFENALRAEAALPATMAESLKALESRLAFGVDLAAIESLALALLPSHSVGRVQLGQARSRPRAVLVGIRMQLLRLPAEGALDLRSARGLRYPKNIVGVTHPPSLPGNSPLLCEYRPNRIDSMWWARAYTAMRVGKVQEAPIVRRGRRGLRLAYVQTMVRSGAPRSILVAAAGNASSVSAMLCCRRADPKCLNQCRYNVLPG